MSDTSDGFMQGAADRFKRIFSPTSPKLINPAVVPHYKKVAIDQSSVKKWDNFLTTPKKRHDLFLVCANEKQSESAIFILMMQQLRAYPSESMARAIYTICIPEKRDNLFTHPDEVKLGTRLKNKFIKTFGMTGHSDGYKDFVGGLNLSNNIRVRLEESYRAGNIYGAFDEANQMICKTLWDHTHGPNVSIHSLLLDPPVSSPLTVKYAQRLTKDLKVSGFKIEEMGIY